MKTLEFLIPSYKRPETLPLTVDSVVRQIVENHLETRVSIMVVDDCSPNVDAAVLADKFSSYKDIITYSKNQINKGMSLNIRDMVASSQADYCCILTDDDRLQPGALTKIITVIDGLNDLCGTASIGAFYVPRYSYLEDGSLHCIVCEPFKTNRIIEPGPLSMIKYLHDGFILTGLFFQPRLINFHLWDQHVENVFFPLIYFSDLLGKHRCLFVHDNWFIHTVLNECHWESWGTTEKARYTRLYKDYMEVVSIAAEEAFSRTSHLIDILLIFIEEVKRYAHQISSALTLNVDNLSVYPITRRRVSYWVARFLMLKFNRFVLINVGRAGRLITK